jgi:uncharacterized protein (DUF1800 family)
MGTGYTEDDIREASRALTGFEFRSDSYSYGDYGDPARYVWNPDAWDPGVKNVFGKRGKYRPDAIVDLCLGQPEHSEFVCRSLWRYFSPDEPPGATLAEMKDAYLRSGRKLRPVLRVILRSAAFYANLDAPDLVKPPVVYLAGAMRATGTYVRSDVWVYLLFNMGQAPFYPPNVGGWDQNEAFLATASNKSRWETIAFLLESHPFPDEDVPPDEPAPTALHGARAFAGQPWTTSTTDERLERFARDTEPSDPDDTHTAAERRRVLRHLLLAGPDAQVH